MTAERSSFILDESVRVVQPTLACALGVCAAMVLQQIHWLLLKFGKEADGAYWIALSLADLRGWLPFFSKNTLHRALLTLVKKDLLLCRDDLNEHGYDRTKWYRLNDQRIDALYGSKAKQSQQIPKMGNADPQNGKSYKECFRDKEREEIERESDTDSRTGDLSPPTEESFSLSLESQKEETEKPEPDDTAMNGRVPTYCQFFDSMAVCDCIKEAQDNLTDLLGYKPQTHENLHWFVHAYGQEDLLILYNYTLKHERDRRFWRPGAVCSRKSAPDNLAIAKQALAEQAEKSRRTVCMHPPRQIVHDERQDTFVCTACWESITERQATERGVEVSSETTACRKKSCVAFSPSSKRPWVLGTSRTPRSRAMSRRGGGQRSL